MKNKISIIIVLLSISTVVFSQVVYETKKSMAKKEKIKKENKKRQTALKANEGEINIKNIQLYMNEMEKYSKNLNIDAKKCVKGDQKACQRASSTGLKDLELSCKYNTRETACEEFENEKARQDKK